MFGLFTTDTKDKIRVAVSLLLEKRHAPDEVREAVFGVLENLMDPPPPPQFPQLFGFTQPAQPTVGEGGGGGSGPGACTTGAGRGCGAVPFRGLCPDHAGAGPRAL